MLALSKWTNVTNSFMLHKNIFLSGRFKSYIVYSTDDEWFFSEFHIITDRPSECHLSKFIRSSGLNFQHNYIRLIGSFDINLINKPFQILQNCGKSYLFIFLDQCNAEDLANVRSRRNSRKLPVDVKAALSISYDYEEEKENAKEVAEENLVQDLKNHILDHTFDGRLMYKNTQRSLIDDVKRFGHHRIPKQIMDAIAAVLSIPALDATK